jgi:hypothetical protein
MNTVLRIEYQTLALEYVQTREQMAGARRRQ